MLRLMLQVFQFFQLLSVFWCPLCLRKSYAPCYKKTSNFRFNKIQYRYFSESIFPNIFCFPLIPYHGKHRKRTRELSHASITYDSRFNPATPSQRTDTTPVAFRAPQGNGQFSEAAFHCTKRMPDFYLGNSLAVDSSVLA